MTYMSGGGSMKSAHKKATLSKIVVYVILIIIALLMIIPFLWMLSASIKSDREVFQMNPFVWIPETPRWSNYTDIYQKYCVSYYRCYCSAASDKLFCCICVWKAEI